MIYLFVYLLVNQSNWPSLSKYMCPSLSICIIQSTWLTMIIYLGIYHLSILPVVAWVESWYLIFPRRWCPCPGRRWSWRDWRLQGLGVSSPVLRLVSKIKHNTIYISYPLNLKQNNISTMYLSIYYTWTWPVILTGRVISTMYLSIYYTWTWSLT